MGLIEYLGLTPAHVAGISSGGSVALRLAARHPRLVRSVITHEPGLFGLFFHDPDQGAQCERHWRISKRWSPA